MIISEKQTLNIAVEGEEVNTLKSALSTIVNADREVGFARYPLSEKEVKLLVEIQKQIIK